MSARVEGLGNLPS